MKKNKNQLFILDGHQICIISDASEKRPELGTGFLFLKRDWIVTAAHVVLKEDIPRENLYAEFPTRVPTRLKLKVLAIHNECDIALLLIDAEVNPCKKPLFPGYEDLSVSVGLVTCGYTPSDGRKIKMSLVSTFNLEYRERSATEVIFEFQNGDVEPGSSGGPIFGDGGVVLGILINTFSIADKPDSQFIIATSIHNLLSSITISLNETNLLLFN